MKQLIYLLLLFCCFACERKPINENWPDELKQYEIGIQVAHSTDTVYVTENKKDPEKWGKYQLQFTTTVSAMKEDLEIVEFGGYNWENEDWVLRSIYDRPFNKAEFEKWYACPNGILKKGQEYTDPDNWMGKSNQLRDTTLRGLWYFIGKSADGIEYVGAKEIIGVCMFE